jgi:hypothetical protein
VYVTGSNKRRVGFPDYATVAYDATSGAELWTLPYNGTGNNEDYATAIVVSPDGSEVFVAGVSSGSVSQDYATISYDAATGTKQWAKRYDGPSSGIDQATSLGVSPDGATVFVTGASTSGPDTDYDAATIAYDSVTGSRLWVRRYNDRGNRDDVGFSVRVSPRGNRVFVAGYSHSLTLPTTTPRSLTMLARGQSNG